MANKDFQEKELGKAYDSRLMKRLLKYTKPFIALFLIALIFLLISVGTDLIRPYLLKVTIDNYLFREFTYFKVTDNIDKYDLDFDGKKLKKIEIGKNKITSIKNKNGYYTVFKIENKTFISDKIVYNKLNKKDIPKFVLTKSQIDQYKKVWINEINNIGFIFVLLIIIGFIMNFLHLYVLNKTSQTIIYRIRQDIFSHISRLPLSFFDKNPVGRVVTRITNDTETINEMFTSVLVNFIKDIAIFIGVLVIMFFLNPTLTYISVLSLPFVLVAAYFFRKFIRQIYRMIRINLAKINSILSEYISGMKIIQIFNKEKDSIKNFNKVSNDYYKTTLKEIKLYGLFRPYIEMVSNTALAVIVWYGGSMILKSKLEFGVVVAFANYIGILYQPINDLAEKFNIFQASMASSERIFTILDEDEEIFYKNNEMTDFKLKGNIEFRNVWFCYNKGEYVLKDVSFKINSGETVAIVGSTGSGKTTIINLLNMFYNFERGYITIDNKNINEYDTEFLRRSIAYVPQDVFLFKGNIIDNIRLADKFSDIEVETACRYVNADIFIDRFSDKYYHEVIEGGTTLSTGQRQLISFARALVRDPAILVLDEATSNIDTETEELIQNALDKISKGRTTLIIAHRLSTIKKADRILVMNKGRIIETGNHDDLIEKQGVYYDLYKLQYNLEIS